MVLHPVERYLGRCFLFIDRHSKFENLKRKKKVPFNWMQKGEANQAFGSLLALLKTHHFMQHSHLVTYTAEIADSFRGTSNAANEPCR